MLKRDIVTGKGPAAKSGDDVTVKYVGVNWSAGKQFDASWDRNTTFPFTLGTGAVIKGWDDGLVGMQAGGRRVLVDPGRARLRRDRLGRGHRTRTRRWCSSSTS